MDIEYLLWLQGIREMLGPFIEALMNVLTYLGSSTVLAVVPCLLYWLVDKKLGMFVMVNLGIGTNLNQTVKDTACVYRPWIRDTRIHPSPAAIGHATGYSFPSGHTQGAGAVFGSLAWRLREKRALSVVLIAIVLIVGFSRNFLGVHTPQDVIVALAETALVIWLSEAVIAWAGREATKDTTVLAIGLAAVAALAAYTTFKPYPLDYVGGVLLVDPTEMRLDAYSSMGILLGIVTGWFFEHRYVRFTTDCSAKQKVIRVVVCGIVLALFMGAAQLVKYTVGGATYAVVKGLFPSFIGIFAGPAISAPLERRFAPSDTACPRESE